MEGIAVGKELSSLSGLICEIVSSVGQGNVTFVRKKSGRSQGFLETSGCANHALSDYFIKKGILPSTTDSTLELIPISAQ